MASRKGSPPRRRGNRILRMPKARQTGVSRDEFNRVIDHGTFYALFDSNDRVDRLSEMRGRLVDAVLEPAEHAAARRAVRRRFGCLRSSGRRAEGGVHW